MCSYCQLANLTTKIHGLTVVFEEVPSSKYEHMRTYLEDEAPVELMAYCSRLTFTPDLGKYEPKYKGPTYNGFARHPSGLAYVKVTVSSENDQLEQTTIHELAHTYDYAYSYTGRFSSSARWREIHAAEGNNLARKYYCYRNFAQKSETSKRVESYAMAVAAYFTDYAGYEWDDTPLPKAMQYVAAQFGG